jgi:hypothetical protein
MKRRRIIEKNGQLIIREETQKRRRRVDRFCKCEKHAKVVKYEQFPDRHTQKLYRGDVLKICEDCRGFRLFEDFNWDCVGFSVYIGDGYVESYGDHLQ